jgi:hypothetical protein
MKPINGNFDSNKVIVEDINPTVLLSMPVIWCVRPPIHQDAIIEVGSE